jgi:hypothetical protein
MSEHDYNLINQTGANLRADLNSVLSAIVSQNSKATELTTMFAYMLWADTTTGLLKQRNAANTAWIEIGTLASANLGLALVGGLSTQVFSVAAATSAAHAVPLAQFQTITNPTLTLSGSTGNPTTPVTTTAFVSTSGREVTVTAAFSNVDTTGASGNLRVTGLPVAPSSNLIFQGSVTISGFGTNPATCFVSGTSLYIYNQVTFGEIPMVAGASKYLLVQVTYFTA